MLRKYGVGIVVLLMLGWGAPPSGAASREQRQTTWEGLSVIIGQKVRIVMPEGTRIEGKVVGVEVDALAVEIARTSNAASYPQGRFLVPRATLKAVDVNHPTRKWRIVCLSIGGAIGGFLAAIAIDLNSNGIHTRHPVVGALTAAAVGVPVTGYLLGRAADRRTITYVIKQ